MKYFVYILGVLSYIVAGISGASMVIAFVYPTPMKPVRIGETFIFCLLLMIIAAALSSGKFWKDLRYILTYSVLIASGYLGVCGNCLFLLFLMRGKIYFLGFVISTISIFAALGLRLYLIEVNKARHLEATNAGGIPPQR